jgi:hypothetical protein
MAEPLKRVISFLRAESQFPLQTVMGKRLSYLWRGEVVSYQFDSYSSDNLSGWYIKDADNSLLHHHKGNDKMQLPDVDICNCSGGGGGGIPPRQEFFIRNGVDGPYGNSSGDSPANAFSGFEGITERIPVNSIVNIVGDLQSNSAFPIRPDLVWNDGVTLIGDNPTTCNRIYAPYEWRTFIGFSNITMENIQWDVAAYRGWEAIISNSPTFLPIANRSQNITITRCKLYGIDGRFIIEVAAGNDGWNVTRNLLTGDRTQIGEADTTAADTGIYLVNRPGEVVAPDNWVITYNTITDIGKLNNSKDNHGIGIQSSNNIIIDNNEIRRTYGDGLAVWTGGAPQKDIKMRDNLVSETFGNDKANGRSLSISTSSGQSSLGQRTGFEITGNYFRFAEGDTMSINNVDAMIIENNDVFEPTVALSPGFSGTSVNHWIEHFIPDATSQQNPVNNRLWDEGVGVGVFSLRYDNPAVNGTLDPSNVVAPSAGAPTEPTNVGVNG